MAHNAEMAHEAHGHHATNTGIDNRKLGFWLFLASECVFFASLIVGYLVYKDHTGGGAGSEVFNIPLTSVSTFVLLMSSLAMVLGVNAAQRNEGKEAMRWVLATAIMGLVFLGFQAYEFFTFITVDGLTLRSSNFGSAFFTLTGFHGTHVLVGVIWLLSLLYHGKGKGLTAEKALDVEIGGLYWHFVDIVWIVIFTVVYLLDKVH